MLERVHPINNILLSSALRGIDYIFGAPFTDALKAAAKESTTSRLFSVTAVFGVFLRKTTWYSRFCTRQSPNFFQLSPYPVATSPWTRDFKLVCMWGLEIIISYSNSGNETNDTGKPVDIEAITLVGNKSMCSMNRSECVIDLKWKIQSRKGLPGDQHRLIFRGIQLQYTIMKR
jgi:hypothetical protein